MNYHFLTGRGPPQSIKSKDKTNFPSKIYILQNKVTFDTVA